MFDNKITVPSNFMTSTMSKSSGVQIPVINTSNNIAKVHQTSHRSRVSSLPSIPRGKTMRHRNKPERLSSNSFLLRLMSIDQMHEQRKQEQYQLSRNKREEINDALASGDDNNLMGHPTRPVEFGFPDESCGQRFSGQITDNSRDSNYITIPTAAPAESIQQEIDIYHPGPHQSRLPFIPNAHINSNTSISSAESSSSISPYELNVVHSENQQQHRNTNNSSPTFPSEEQNVRHSYDPQRQLSMKKKTLKLPPLLLPPIYSVRPRPLKQREFLSPTKIRGPIGDSEWEELLQCRYIRHTAPKKIA